MTQALQADHKHHCCSNTANAETFAAHIHVKILLSRFPGSLFNASTTFPLNRRDPLPGDAFEFCSLSLVKREDIMNLF
jgi:hypothetical protein